MAINTDMRRVHRGTAGRRTVVAIGAMLLAGCATALGHASVHIVEHSVVYAQQGAGAQITVTAVISNAASSRLPLVYGSCNWMLEKRVTSGWQPVLTTVCLGFGASDTITPGHSITRAVLLSGSTDPNRRPLLAWPDSIPGTYRVGLDFRFLNADGLLVTDPALKRSLSNGFEVRSPPS